jgi:LacI family transcriptional regulator
MRDIAEAAGVDVSVVSRVLSGDARLSVKPDTRQRILDAAAELKYRPNRAARSLKTSRTMELAILLPDLQNVAYATIVQGAEARASAAGYILLVATGSIPERVRMLEGRIDGLLIASATSGSELPAEVGERLPAILVNRRESGRIPSVVMNDREVAALAVDHLVMLGHTRIAHVAGPQETDTGRRRMQGFAEQMRASGLEVVPEFVVEGPYTEAAGFASAIRLLHAKPRPTAIFTANFASAVGVLAAARRLGVRIPDELSVVGFDDVTMAQFVDPPLSTVRSPLAEMGSLAVESLLDAIAGKDVRDVVVDVPPELVMRGSSGPPPAIDASPPEAVARGGRTRQA